VTIVGALSLIRLSGTTGLDSKMFYILPFIILYWTFFYMFQLSLGHHQEDKIQIYICKLRERCTELKFNWLYKIWLYSFLTKCNSCTLSVQDTVGLDTDCPVLAWFYSYININNWKCNYWNRYILPEWCTMSVSYEERLSHSCASQY
jgi:hypothetical protein